MQTIETAWKKWFLQFTNYVFTEGELVEDPNNTKYPRITFSYQIGDFAVNTLTTFQVWDWSHNNSRLWEICAKITEAVPVQTGTAIIIPGEDCEKFGKIMVWRGNPFLTPSPKDEVMLRVQYGTLQARYRTTV